MLAKRTTCKLLVQKTNRVFYSTMVKRAILLSNDALQSKAQEMHNKYNIPIVSAQDPNTGLFIPTSTTSDDAQIGIIPQFLLQINSQDEPFALQRLCMLKFYFYILQLEQVCRVSKLRAFMICIANFLHANKTRIPIFPCFVPYKYTIRKCIRFAYY